MFFNNVEVIYHCLQNFAWTHQTIINFIHALSKFFTRIIQAYELIGSLCVKFHNWRCKRKAITRKPFFRYQCVVTLTIWQQHRLKTCQTSTMSFLVFTPPPLFKKWLDLFAVTVGWLLLDIVGWLVLLIPKSTRPTLNSWEVCMWCFVIIGIKWRQFCAKNHFQ